jgi:hypothetical protein
MRYRIRAIAGGDSVACLGSRWWHGFFDTDTEGTPSGEQCGGVELPKVKKKLTRKTRSISRKRENFEINFYLYITDFIINPDTSFS